MFGILTAFKRSYKKCQISRDYAVMRLGQRFNPPAKAARVILFILGDDTLNQDEGRNAYIVTSLFNDAGYSVHIYPRKQLNRRAYHKMGYCARRVFDMKNVKLVDRLPESCETICLATDDYKADTEALKRPWKRWVYVNILKASELNVGTMLQVPYSMHPKIHAHRSSFDLKKSRESRRTLRLLFAGNTHKDYYDNHIVKAQGTLSRLEALGVAKAHRGPVEEVTSGDVFYQRMKIRDYFRGCVLVETGSFGIPASRWLETLSRSDFFLCFSGTDFPMCHNAIEVMAVGTIPVIGYADWFSPPLEHGKNAVVFSDAKDLDEKIRMVLEMPSEKIIEMRKNAADYYDRHLSSKNFVARFEAMPQGPGTLSLFPLYRAAEPAREMAGK